MGERIYRLVDATLSRLKGRSYRLDRDVPLGLLAGGYIGVFSVTDGTGWQQQTAEKVPVNLRHRGHVGSRRERRAISRNQWLTSLPLRKIASNAQQYRQHVQTIQRRKQAA